MRSVLIVSTADDWSAEQVAARLAARSVPYRWLDPADFPQRLRLAARFDTRWHGHLATSAENGEPIDLGSVGAVFYRRPGDFDLPVRMSGPERRFARAQARVGLGGILASLSARWINHPSALADSEYKPRQLALAAAVGLTTPPTLITNDPAEVRAFADQIGSIVVKPLAEPIVHEADSHTVVWTRKVTDADLVDLSGVEVTAHLFQQWVGPKKYEVRLIAVGRRLLPVAIHAGSPQALVDWRSDYDSLTYTRLSCPEHVATGVHAYLEAAGLIYAAFDFVVTKSGEWVFLECNAAGQWGWLTEECELPVAEAIADELTDGVT